MSKVDELPATRANVTAAVRVALTRVEAESERLRHWLEHHAKK